IGSESESAERGKCNPGSRIVPPGLHRLISGGRYRDAFFFPGDFFMRTAAFFAGFFFATFAMIPPPFQIIS
ncbi:MAG TPA: hypothetical protein DD706_00660, partial [Nitrospiraceae bacterium]|nr:hypothetical protein [Nitrospiraceae bacterium]